MKITQRETSRLIETINLLGPWVHGYFELPCGVTIKDNDLYQRARLFQLRDTLIRIIGEHFKGENLQDKTLCDVGCNAGYFLFELYKHFGFKKAQGFDPRKTNVDKARFIAKQFALPKDRYSVAMGNVYNLKNKVYDVVIMPGVLHHLDDHILACKRLFDMTGGLLILDTMGLPGETESPCVAKYLELKDDIYKSTRPIFGVTGLKLESEYLDGATATSGVVAIPSKNSLYLSLFNAGFRDIKLFDVHDDLESVESLQPRYRDFCTLLAVAVKPKEEKGNVFEDTAKQAQQAEIDVCVPSEVIEPLYNVVQGVTSAQELVQEARTIWYGFVKPDTATPVSCKELESRPYCGILRSFVHQPADKIRVEFAKSLFHSGHFDQAKAILDGVVKTLNCDWRCVYRGYHILSLIALAEGRHAQARLLNGKALKAHPNFFPAKAARQLMG